MHPPSENEAKRLAEESARDEDQDCDEQPAHRIGQVSGVNNPGQEAGREIDARSEAHPGRHPGQEAQPVSTHGRAERHDHDDPVEDGHCPVTSSRA